jgi:hypothetical protein
MNAPMLEAAVIIALGAFGAVAAWVLWSRPPALPGPAATPRERVEARLAAARFEPIEGRWQRRAVHAARTEVGIELSVEVARGVEVTSGRLPRVDVPEALAWFDDHTLRRVEGLLAHGGMIRDGRLTVPAEALLDDLRVPEVMEAVATRLRATPTREDLAELAYSSARLSVAAAEALAGLDPERLRPLREDEVPTKRLLTAVALGDWDRALPLLEHDDVPREHRQRAVAALVDRIANDPGLADAALRHLRDPDLRAKCALAAGRVADLLDLHEVRNAVLRARIWEAAATAEQQGLMVARCLRDDPEALAFLLDRPAHPAALDKVRDAADGAVTEEAGLAMVVRLLSAWGSLQDVPRLRSLRQPGVETAVAAIQERAGGAPGGLSIADEVTGGLSVVAATPGEISEAE